MYLPFISPKNKHGLPVNTSEEIQDIVKGCRRNNRESQKQLFNWLKDYSVNICYRYATHFIETQDLVSEGFMKVYKNIDQYNDLKFGFTEAAFKGWFKRVLINNSINYLKQHDSLFTSEEVEQDYLTNTQNSNTTAIENIKYKEVINEVMKLPNSYKMVFCLFAIDGYSHEEIATALGISIGASKSNLFKARQHLKKSILQ